MELSPMLIICIFSMWQKFQIYDFSPHIQDLSYASFAVSNYEREFITAEISCFGVFVFLILFLITDALRYKSIILLTLILMVPGDLSTFFALDRYLSVEVYDIITAINFASSIANSSYLYSIMQDKSSYQKITAYVHASGIVGLCMGFVWTQIYAHTLHHLSNLVLPILIRLIMTTIMLILFFKLPPVDINTSNNAENTIHLEQQINPPSNTIHKIQNTLETGISQIWYNLMTAYSNLNVLKWSIWYILTSFLITQVEDGYVEIPIFNHLVMFEILTSISALSYFIYLVISAGLIIFRSLKPTQWETQGDLILSVVSFVLAILTLIRYIHLPQIILIIVSEIFTLVVDVFITISLWEIVAMIPRNSYALIMGFNIFVIQVLKITSWKIFKNKKCMIIYGMIFLGLGVVFGILEKRRRRPPPTQSMPFLEDENGPDV